MPEWVPELDLTIQRNFQPGVSEIQNLGETQPCPQEKKKSRRRKNKTKIRKFVSCPSPRVSVRSKHPKSRTTLSSTRLFRVVSTRRQAESLANEISNPRNTINFVHAASACCRTVARELYTPHERMKTLHATESRRIHSFSAACFYTFPRMCSSPTIQRRHDFGISSVRLNSGTLSLGTEPDSVLEAFFDTPPGEA